MRSLIFATNNPFKLSEIREILGGYATINPPSSLGCFSEIPETGNTLEENAAQKALYILKHYGVDCFADDTGLEVDALNGAPGVYSARYAGETKSFSENMDKLLNELAGNPNRNARFRTVIALTESGKIRFFEGVVRGVITENKRGSGGFGYDPVFIPEGYDLTFAEMNPAKKNRISHRALAVKKLCDYLAG